MTEGIEMGGLGDKGSSKKCQCPEPKVPIDNLQFHFEVCANFPALPLELDYEFSLNHRGPPVIKKDFASKHHMLTQFCPVAATNETNDFTPEGTRMEVRFKNDHSAEFEGWADIIKKGSPWYDENGWRRENGSVPDLILGPSFLATKKADQENFAANTVVWRPNQEGVSGL